MATAIEILTAGKTNTVGAPDLTETINTQLSFDEAERDVIRTQWSEIIQEKIDLAIALDKSSHLGFGLLIMILEHESAFKLGNRLELI